jgi:hypothetical protein
MNPLYWKKDTGYSEALSPIYMSGIKIEKGHLQKQVYIQDNLLHILFQDITFILWVTFMVNPD